MKKILVTILIAVLAISMVACASAPAVTSQPATSSAASAPSAAPTQAASDFDASSDITVVSREDGSGTRGAFIELTGVQTKKDDGTKVDNTTKDAVIAPQTDVMMTNVAGDEYAIGYASLGSLNNTVKALKVDGIAPSTATVKDGTYTIARPFNIATKGEATGLAKDFIDYILSAEGQEVISNGYIKIDDSAKPYAGTMPAGKIVVAGSSSVTPIMEKLVEAYKKVNTKAEIEVQMSDSTAGMKAAMDGTCDIGMASRELSDEEKAVLKDTSIALDGIAMIVNTKNPLEDIAKADIAKIFTGEATTWDGFVK